MAAMQDAQRRREALEARQARLWQQQQQQGADARRQRVQEEYARRAAQPVEEREPWPAFEARVGAVEREGADVPGPPERGLREGAQAQGR